MANGGIGVSYSNVVLAGGLNPSDEPYIGSNYKQQFKSQRQDMPRGYAQGLEFNARQKYDYNILNGQNLSTSTLKGRQEPVL